MKQDMIVILDLGSTENTVVARAIRDMGVYSEIHPHDITVDGLKALDMRRAGQLRSGMDKERRRHMKEGYGLLRPKKTVV